MLADQLHHMPQQYLAVDPLVAWIAIREMTPDIPECQRPQQGVAESMDGYVGITVSQQP